MIVIAPFTFLALLLWDDPRKRRWLAILNHSSASIQEMGRFGTRQRRPDSRFYPTASETYGGRQ